MCYYNGRRVSRTEFIRLMAIEKEIKNLQLYKPYQSGFDYGDWPIVKPLAGGKDFEVRNVHWEYIPPSIHNEEELKEARKMYTWLNAKSENLFVNEWGKPSMYKEGALKGRCLVISSGFFEWRHLPKIGKKGQELKEKEKIPYYITLKNQPEYFFMAGVSRVWTNHLRQQSADTFAIITTEANTLMRQVHNNKNRMPTILPEELAYEWIQDGLSEERIKEIATYQLPSNQMEAWTIRKDFKEQNEPTERVQYENVPELVYEE
jgi:putative SOS response-associated peptidase YedK